MNVKLVKVMKDGRADKRRVGVRLEAEAVTGLRKGQRRLERSDEREEKQRSLRESSKFQTKVKNPKASSTTPPWRIWNFGGGCSGRKSTTSRNGRAISHNDRGIQLPYAAFTQHDHVQALYAFPARFRAALFETTSIYPPFAPSSAEMSTDDVFVDSTESIVDCDVLEAAKENIQPIAKGRRVTALSAILSTPHAQRDNRLAAARNRHRINVEVALEDEDDDPLEAYCRFVDWTVESYPQGHSAESGLLELLEEATRVLKNDRDGKWKDDIRYLRLWVLYASYVEKPAIIFKFCMVNEIGTTHALLYEEFASALEKAGRRV